MGNILAIGNVCIHVIMIRNSFVENCINHTIIETKNFIGNTVSNMIPAIIEKVIYGIAIMLPSKKYVGNCWK